MGTKKKIAQAAGVVGGLVAAAGVLLGIGVAADAKEHGRTVRQTLFGAASFAEWDGKAVFFGDSITDYCDLEVYYPGLNAVNMGISGDTTGGMLERIERSVYSQEPDVVVFLGGVNDILSGYDDSATVANIRAILEGVRANLPKAEVLVQSIYPVSEYAGSDFNSHIRAVNDEIKNMAKELGCRYVDVYSAMATAEGRLDGRYSYDGLHPNEEGYAVACPIVAKELEKITGKGILG